MKKYPSWRVPDTYIDINYVVLFRTLGPACEHPWEEHALKTVWLYKGKCAFCFVLLCSLQGKITDKKEAAGDRGKSEEEKAKKSLWKATQQSSFDHLTISQLKGWPGNNPPKRDVTIAAQVPGLQADTHLTCPTELHQPTHIRPLLHICIRLLDQSVNPGSLWSGSHVFTDVWTKRSTTRLWSFWTSGS